MAAVGFTAGWIILGLIIIYTFVTGNRQVILYALAAGIAIYLFNMLNFALSKRPLNK